MGIFDDDDNDSKRVLGIRDKQILYRKANKKCQNPGCNKDIEFDEMQVGHKIAWSKRGRTTLTNSVCLCYRCNKLQGTDSWATFLRKQGVQDASSKIKGSLDNLSISQLKALAKASNIKVKGTTEDDMFDSTTHAPTKKQYIKKLASVVTDEEIRSLRVESKTSLSAESKPKKKKRHHSRDDSWGW